MSSLSPLATSEPKSKFIERLGLDAPGRQHVYSIMKHEAAMAWRRLQNDRSSLRSHLRERENVHRPYTYGQIHEAALSQEVFNILHLADIETRPYYALDHESGTLNWIVRWLLWHTFRDRDQRKKFRRGRSGLFDGDEQISDLGVPSGRIQGPGCDFCSTSMHDQSTFSGSTQALEHDHGGSMMQDSTVVTMTDMGPAPRMPYDPVRDC